MLSIDERQVIMILVFILIGIASAAGIPDAQLMWHWFGSHEFLTILMLIFLA
jgi:hypothetical protein